MKNKFPGYIDNYLKENILASKKVTVVLDTNILLNLYRYEKTVADDIIKQIESLKNNDYFDVWLPHQSALEFNLNRKLVLKNQESLVNKIEQKFKSFTKELDGLSKIGGENSELYALKSELGNNINHIYDIIKSHKPKKNNYKKEDKVVEIVYELFDGIVGESFSKEEMEQIEKEGEYRYSNNIPPGYEDDIKETVYSYAGVKVDAKYGDLILWNQMINKCRESATALVLVTGDEKSDWKSKEFDRVRPELITEFNLKTGQDFYALTLNQFQRNFSDKLEHKLSKETTEGIRELIKKDNVGWLDAILAAFHHYNKPLMLKDISSYILDNIERDFPPTWEVIIRRTIYNHCSDVKLFLGKKDLFKKLDSGKYELRS